jgi:hypothetical protein
MKYKNTKTGAIIDSSCKISGGDWIEYVRTEIGKEVADEVSDENEVEEQIEEQIEESAIDGVTKKQIMQELDAMGIKYDPKARKEVLYNIMLGK